MCGRFLCGTIPNPRPKGPDDPVDVTNPDHPLPNKYEEIISQSREPIPVFTMPTPQSLVQQAPVSDTTNPVLITE